MDAIFDKLRDLRRRYFRRYRIDDPRPIAKKSPYTFYLPSPEELDALEKGDLAKMVFRSTPQSSDWGAERMWVLITEISPSGLKGNLNNEPVDLPQLKFDDVISFQRFHIIDIDWADSKKADQFADQEKQIWDRCMVDTCILEDDVPIYYLYREEPDLGDKDDKFADSGWRIRGDYRGLTDDEIEARDAQYIALGVVLNIDDSWLHLIDEPVGSAFFKNPDSGEITLFE